MIQVTGYKDEKGRFYDSIDHYNLAQLQDEYLTVVWEYEKSLTHDEHGFIKRTTGHMNSTLQLMLSNPHEFQALMERLVGLYDQIQALETKLKITTDSFTEEFQWWKFWKR